MSREIDLDKPLSDADRKYLLDRDRWRDVEANAEEFGGKPPARPVQLPVTGPEATINALGPTGLTAQQQAEYDAEQAAGPEPEVAYKDMTVPELKEELTERLQEAATEEEKANLTYKSGDAKGDLIAKLELDDELVAGRE